MKKESITEIEQRFMDDFNALEDWFFQYEYLLEMGAELEPMLPAERNDDTRVPGCQSGVWLALSENPDRTIHIRTHSDTLIIRGMLAVIVTLLNDRTPAELISFRERFISETALAEQISSDRFAGLSSVIQRIRAYASGLSPMV